MKKRTGLRADVTQDDVREEDGVLSSPAAARHRDDDFMRGTLRMMLQAINDKSAAQGKSSISSPTLK